MSRYGSYQQKQFAKKVVIFSITLLIFIIFLFKFGINLLVNSSLFIGNLISGNKKINTLEKKNFFYGNISVDSIPNATNSAKIIVSGNASNYDLIEFYINDEKVKEISYITSDDGFSEEIGDLKEGKNEVHLEAKSNQSKNTKETEKFIVFYKDEKPKLEINEPKDQLTVSKSEIKISGATDKETFIKINNLPTVVDSQGNFQTLFKLQNGENKIEITASDIAGNIESKTLTVTFKKED